MESEMTRRQLLRAGGIAAVAAVSGTAGPLLAQGVAPTLGAAPAPGRVKLLGLSCSPRRGMTTATAVQAALDAARTVDGRIETELLDLGGLNIQAGGGAARAGAATQARDDFETLLPKLRDPAVGGLIIGSPVYFRSLSALCKAFLERCGVLREPQMLWADKAVGALAVGAFRNGGQELVIEQIQTIMLCFEAVVVGGKPRAHQGATLWNGFEDDITKDEFGMDTARKLGIRVAEAALRLGLKPTSSSAKPTGSAG